MVDLMFRDVAVLALSAVQGAPELDPPWSATDVNAVRRAAARVIRLKRDAAALLGRDAPLLVDGIALTSFIEPAGGPFGPLWSAHPFGSPALKVGYKLREVDITQELARLMGPLAGRRGPERALSFLQVLADLTRCKPLREALTGKVRPVVTAEHPVIRSTRKTPVVALDAVSAPQARSRRSVPRIDLLFEWPVGSGNQQAVVVIEAKLGAKVSPSQLLPYSQEALKRARGGPVTRILLTLRPDRAERRHRSWFAVRWFAVMRRWEGTLAAAGDDDAEFTRLRAHVWRSLLHS